RRPGARTRGARRRDPRPPRGRGGAPVLIAAARADGRPGPAGHGRRTGVGTRATGVSRSPVAARSRGGARRAALAQPPAPAGLAGRCQGRGALRTAPDRFRADRRAAARRDLARRRDPARRADRDRRRRGLPACGPATRSGRGRAAHAV
ncbi:MAG: hypothetical protein AVDCRST_MAG38-807, partial [uncultured Solirubrobacteraceae bacterium]